MIRKLLTRKLIITISVILCVLVAVLIAPLYINTSFTANIGDEIDSFNGVSVYHNGGLLNSSGRNMTADGYNLGQKYQCVEFIKRYYYEHYSHKMPETYGHAYQFFIKAIADGELNPQRGLNQYTNGSASKPQTGDILVMGGGKFGHVAIVTEVADGKVQFIQQNKAPTRDQLSLHNIDGKWRIDSRRVLGWLRIP